MPKDLPVPRHASSPPRCTRSSSPRCCREHPIIPAPGTNVARRSPSASTTASSWPIGVRSSVATARRLDRRARPCVRDWRRMRLLPREQDRLLLFLAAELARRRRGRGLRLNQAEAVALIADTVCEAARDGRSYDEAEAAGYAALGMGDVLDGAAGLVGRV